MRRSVRAEVVGAFGVLLVAVAGIGAYAVIGQARAVDSLRLQGQHYLPIAFALDETHAAQVSLGTLLEHLADQRDRAPARAWISGTRRTRRAVIARLRGDVRAALDAARSPDDRALLARADASLATVDRTYREDEPAIDALFEALAGRESARLAASLPLLLAREQSAADTLRVLFRGVESRMRALAVEADERQVRTLRLLLATTVAAIAVGVFLLLAADRALRPLVLLTARARSVAAGDLRVQIIPARDDEIGELAREFAGMVGAVEQRDTALRERADAIERAERRLEELVATLRAAVVVVRADGTIDRANPAAGSLAPDAVAGAQFAGCTLGRIEAVAAAAVAVREPGQGPVVLLNVVCDARMLDVTVVPFRAPDGDGTGALVVADDVTEREQARARLLQNERLAAIGRMAAHVTHEVRNPLSSMALNAEMLVDEARGLGPGAGECERLAGAIQREIDRLTSITEEYLRVARLPRPRLEREDVGAVVSDVAGVVRLELERSGVLLDVRVAGELPAVMLDEAQIRQALLNLLRNAREAVEEHGANRRIVVAVDRREASVEISVSDSGAGLPDEARARLFELFFTTKERGSGLGLPLTREIVLAHGGTLEVDRAPLADGGGARFVITLPAAPERTGREDHDDAN